MIIGSKLPPQKTDRTYFHSGRAAFAYLIGTVIRPRRVHLPAFTCWSLVSAMSRRFPGIELAFYPVQRDLTCLYPAALEKDETLVFIHFFGHENAAALPGGDGILVEDLSHSYLSGIRPRGHHVFGSYRKIMKVADGGFIHGFHNPVYEADRKLDSWLRLEARDWRDIREAENMLDREWAIADISGQSLAVLLAADEAAVGRRRQENERFLATHLQVGEPQIVFRPREVPMIHNRLMATREERDSLRDHLAGHQIFTSIHWPTHELIRQRGEVAGDALWLEDHVISFPVSHDYGEEDMARLCQCVSEWERRR